MYSVPSRYLTAALRVNPAAVVFDIDDRGQLFVVGHLNDATFVAYVARNEAVKGPLQVEVAAVHVTRALAAANGRSDVLLFGADHTAFLIGSQSGKPTPGPGYEWRRAFQRGGSGPATYDPVDFLAVCEAMALAEGLPVDCAPRYAAEFQPGGHDYPGAVWGYRTAAAVIPLRPSEPRELPEFIR